MDPKMPGRTTGCISVSYGNDIYLSVDCSANWSGQTNSNTTLGCLVNMTDGKCMQIPCTV